MSGSVLNLEDSWLTGNHQKVDLALRFSSRKLCEGRVLIETENSRSILWGKNQKVDLRALGLTERLGDLFAIAENLVELGPVVFLELACLPGSSDTNLTLADAK